MGLDYKTSLVFIGILNIFFELLQDRLFLKMLFLNFGDTKLNYNLLLTLK